MHQVPVWTNFNSAVNCNATIMRQCWDRNYESDILGALATWWKPHYKVVVAQLHNFQYNLSKCSNPFFTSTFRFKIAHSTPLSALVQNSSLSFEFKKRRKIAHIWDDHSSLLTNNWKEIVAWASTKTCSRSGRANFLQDQVVRLSGGGHQRRRQDLQEDDVELQVRL